MTLVEVLISVTLAAIILSGAYSCFRNGTFAYKRLEKRLQADNAARQVLSRIHNDLRNAFWYSQTDAKFKGTENKVTFYSLIDEYEAEKFKRKYASVTYDWDGKRLKRSCRKFKDKHDSAKKEEAEEIGADIRNFAFSYGYIDKSTGKLIFVSDWGTLPEPPVAVKSAVFFEDKQYERVTVLPSAYAYENKSQDFANKETALSKE
jgi:Tfp pilus assembly protein PilE